MTQVLTPIVPLVGRVRLAFSYPEKLEKITRGTETITYRRANSPVRLARATDWNTWYEDRHLFYDREKRTITLGDKADV